MSLRLLTIMGSGETAPTMVKVHREVVARLAGGSPRGLLLDTPFGFQTNAAEISARAVGYFRESVGAELEVAGLRSAADLQGASGDAILAKLVAAPLVFAGPGSPTYALRQWRNTLVPSILTEKLALGGALTFASAAALTLGSLSVPVYEIYKVGEDPRWVEGLDLLQAAAGLSVVVIPHYDNAEGGTHDTRYCYLGEERLSAMERRLPPGTFVLGIDEHTAVGLDLVAETATVTGHGVMTVRAAGRSRTVPPGSTLPIASIAEVAADLASGDLHGNADSTGDRARGAGHAGGPAKQGPGTAEPGGAKPGSPLLRAIRSHEDRFGRARDARDVDAMVRAVLDLEGELWDWRADTLQSDEMDRGRAALRAMVAALGEEARAGTRDPAEVIGPYVAVALDLRDQARRDRRFADADDVRDRLVALGIEVHDEPGGSTWKLTC